MVSEPKAHVTKSKATKRAKEKTGEGEQVVQGVGAGPLLAYYMSGMIGPTNTSSLASLPTAKRARVEEGDSPDREM